MQYAATTIVLAALSLFTPGLALPQGGSGSTPTSNQDQYINWAEFKVPQCARGVQHIESHNEFHNGECSYIQWSRSLAYKADFPHSHCDVGFYSDQTCAYEVPTPQPLYTSGLIDGYYDNCFDDILSLNNGTVTSDGLVNDIYVKVTCS